MKKILLTITVFFVALLTMAQSPNLLNYQGVARNSVGNVLPSQPVGLKLSILTSVGGSAVYTETRNVTTNAFGLFNVQVGSPGAITTTGTIAGINWTAFGAGSGPKYLQVEIDPIGGTNYFNVGTTQLVSVPYALNAGAAAPVGPAGGDLTGTYPNPLLKLPLIKSQADAGPLVSITNTGAGNGVQGISTAGGSGLFGSSVSGIGVTAVSTSGDAVNATSTTGSAVRATTNGPFGSFGVFGIATGAATGVAGNSGSGIAVLGVSSTGGAGVFQNFNAANTSNTLAALNQGGAGAAVEGTNTGTGRGGFFQVLNPASTADAVRAETNGTGASWGIRAISSGTNGAGLFQQTNATNTSNNLQSNQAGLGRAGLFNSTNAASTANAVDINVAGTGFALRAASTNGAPKALQTAGGVQLTGIGEANNLILKSDAVGNANWATPASIGVVTGSGTLNFVPKWTPNGTNLGNSQIFDDGTNVGIGTTTPGAGLTVAGSGIWKSAIGIQNTTTGSEWRMNISNTAFQITKIPGATFTPFQLFTDGQVEFPNSTAGNSRLRILDNGNIGMGNNPAPGYRLDVWNGGGNGIRSRSTAAFSVVDIDAANGDEALRLLNNGTGDWHIGGGLFGGLNFYDFKTGLNRMLIQNVSGNVGIGTNSPITRLHVEADAPGSALQTYRNLNNAGYTSSWYLNPAGSLMGHFGYGNPGAGLWADQMFAGSVAAVPFVFTTSDQERMRITPAGDVGVGTATPAGRLNVFQPNAASGLASGTAIFAQKGAFLNQFTNATSILATTSSTNSIGVAAITNDGFAIVGGTVGTGNAVLGQVFAGTGGIGVRAIGSNPATSYALATTGRVIIQGQGAAAGNVLTSDAAGNATWQATAKASIRLKNLSSNITIPFAYTPITQWQTITFEEGGSNYNSGTGEYTVPFAGVYQLTSNLGFFAVGANGYSSLLFYVNGLQVIDSRETAASGTFPGSKASTTVKLNAGDRISVWSYANGSTFQCIGSGDLCTLSITLLHQ